MCTYDAGDLPDGEVEVDVYEECEPLPLDVWCGGMVFFQPGDGPGGHVFNIDVDWGGGGNCLKISVFHCVFVCFC